MYLVAFFQGDSIILGMAHARKIKPEDYPRLYNVVEEMKIASGLEKMPDIYIIDDPALNAFATGRDPNKASVAITSGLLQKLNRDELQGVMGHEISHVRNRDVLLMAITTVMLGTIVILAWYASRFLIFGGMGTRSRRSSSSGGGGYAQIIILAVGLILIILAPIAAQLIYYAVSRKREYLADASSALYTRYPEGLASALEKLATGPELKSANKATAPMYITNPFKTGKRALSDLTSTHPPLADRIRILRAMAGVSYADYDKAYRQVRGKGIVPAAVAASAGAVGLRGPSALSAEEEQRRAGGPHPRGHRRHAEAAQLPVDRLPVRRQAQGAAGIPLRLLAMPPVRQDTPAIAIALKIFFTIVACLGLLLVLLAAAPASFITLDFLRAPASFGRHLGFGIDFLFFWGWYPAVLGVLLALIGGLIARPRYLWIPLVAVGLVHLLSFTGEYVYIVREAGNLVRHPIFKMTQTVAPGLVCIIEGIIVRKLRVRSLAFI